MGFDPLADLVDANGNCTKTQDELSDELGGAVYLKFIDALSTIGHSGEAHCHSSKL